MAGTFEITAWDEETYDEREGAKLPRARVVKTFRDNSEGENTADILIARPNREGSAAYVGFERMVGNLHPPSHG